MHSVTDESGEHHYTIQIPVEPGQEYRYKFRAGGEDDWFLDEHTTIGLYSALGNPSGWGHSLTIYRFRFSRTTLQSTQSASY